MMVESESKPLKSGNFMLDIVGSSIRFSRSLDELRVKLRKNQRIVFGDNGDTSVYFPINCLISLRSSIRSGYTAEFNQIGRDGMVGLDVIFGDGHSGSEAIVLSAGQAYKIESAVARAAFEGSTDFRRTILAYLNAQMREAAQRIVCNKHHSIFQQVCRTLLLASDRLGSETVSLTHEQLAIAIGCRREAVSISAGKLQAGGIIRYGYGKITIIDRIALEHCSCECYSVISNGFAQFMPAKCGSGLPKT